ncbi:dephospho-CoA kinase [Vibrio genomosp. F6]|uniref:dephospho-CoA kinase n=1 Tax=Vibrio genomosp. F6 TaxID=723172 RepID=UPI0010BD535F|nr:dephospho-CoA kinase [Vibrio genomosp. F6]TKF20687.1 dephospho-CoA kinase [Vibrio genomosp. F6]
MALIIGLTGGIASGKTTVSNLFHSQFNIDVVDADIVARQVVEPGTVGIEKIAQHFGYDVLFDNGELNRARLRERIFSDPNDKAWLNELLHPMIREKMLADLNQVTSPYALLVAPLLIENKLQSMVDRILVVDVSEQTQLERTISRDNVSLQQAESILKSQATREQRLQFADDVVKNDTKNGGILSQVTELHQKYLAICRENQSK